MLCTIAKAEIRAWFQHYDNLQYVAILLLYIQVGCSLIGSLGMSYTGVLSANLAIALFALIAIESSSQVLGRTYGVLLICTLLLDIAWFILFSVEIRQLPLNSNLGKLTAFSLQLTLWMQITGFSVRFVSSFIWLKMYRLGSDQGHTYQPVDAEARTGTFGTLSPSSSPRTISLSDEVLGGSIYNPAYYASLFSSLEEAHSLKEMDGGTPKEFSLHGGSHLSDYFSTHHATNEESTS